MKMIPKNSVELQKMRAAGRLAAATLDAITPFVQVGVSTLELNDRCEAFMRQHGGVPATLGYKGYPKASCISRNAVVCHGIPNANEILQDGDILNIDVTVILQGYYGDTSRMYGVGKVSDTAAKLMRAAYDGLLAGMATVTSGSYLHEIGNAIDAVVTPQGFGIVRDYCGHGLGNVFHEDPQVLHYANDLFGKWRLKKGVTFTIEPMVNVGDWRTELQADGWTVLTADRTLSAQYEHTLAVTDDGVEVLTKSPKGYDCWPYG